MSPNTSQNKTFALTMFISGCKVVSFLCFISKVLEEFLLNSHLLKHFLSRRKEKVCSSQLFPYSSYFDHLQNHMEAIIVLKLKSYL